MENEHLKDLALLMTVNCVRNTVIEDYHANDKITQNEMKDFNKEVSNKIYTFLNYMMGSGKADKEKFMQAMTLFYPINWDKPELDKDFTKIIEGTIKLHNKVLDKETR